MTEDTVRDVREEDWQAITAIDASYETGHVLVVEPGSEGGLRLTPRPLPVTQRRSFHIELTADDWTRGWVLESRGRVAGFLATQYSTWNRRLMVWHFYVTLEHRRRGFGRRLIERATEEGQRSGALSVWVETSNYNVPGIACYRRLGFEVCGFDLSLYHGTPRADELAVFLWKPLPGPP